ncbi:hypothetical protein QTP88_001581 [Uroleucon formosanum]
MLSDILSDIDGIELFTFYENEKVIEPEKALPNSVFIFDDIITENQKIARTYFSRGRHNLVDVFYLAQIIAASGEVLRELIKAKENIKRKYTALKQGKADIHSLVSETLSPIIEPLKQNFNKSTFQAPSAQQDIDIQDSQYFNDTGDSLAFKIND